MKKSIRITALLLAILMLALPLVGCDRIDEMRANQGFWNDDGSISFNGQTYKCLSPSDYIHVAWRSNRTLRITPKNVPVLLSEEYGARWYMSYDEAFISDGNRIYCRNDKFDYVEACIAKDAPRDYLGFYYFPYYPADGSTYKVGHVLTEEERDAIGDILDNNKPIGFLDEMNFDAHCAVWLYYCNEDMLSSAKSSICLYLTSENCLFISNGPFVCYIPEKYDALLENMFEELRNINADIFS